MDTFKNKLAVGVTAGVATIVLAPFLVPALRRTGLSLAKSLIMGAISLYNKGVHEGRRSRIVNERRNSLIASKGSEQQVPDTNTTQDNLNPPGAQSTKRMESTT